MFNKILKILNYIIFVIITFLLVFYLIIDNNLFDSKSKLYKSYPNIELRKNVLDKKSIMEHFRNDYNVKFLPQTQFEILNLKKKKIKFKKEYFENKLNFKDSTSYKRYGTFFIDMYLDDLILTDYLGNFYLIKDISSTLNNDNDPDIINISSNLNSSRVYDSFIHKNKIYVSYTSNNNGCNTINLDYAEINYESLVFENFFNPKTCNKTGSPGKIQFIKFNGIPGIIMSTSEGVSDKPGSNTQKIESIFGKTLFIPLDKNLNYSVFSLGHRVIQGLNVYDNLIIATEHGPKGGDEINKILNKTNYGWPVVSLGERYDFKYKNKKLTYKKDHFKNNFQEPIYSFIPSIGISEILKLPSLFSIFYDNHYVVASLNGRSLYFIRFDKNFSKVISAEKVFINQRIRDLKFHKESKSIILALEENGEIGFLNKN